jgi:hypothetical protein
MELDFCPTLETLYRSRQAVGRSGKVFSLTSGLSTINNLLTIRRIMLHLKPDRTLEIGMACGGSALTFAATHRDLQRPAVRQHVAIDGFQQTGFDDVGRIQLEEAGLNDFVEVREQLSSLELPQLVKEGFNCQLVYIDGSHRFEDVFCDFYFVRSLTTVGGFILFDDSSDPDVLKVIKFILANLSHYFERVPISEYRHASAMNRTKLKVAEALHKTQLTIFRKIREGERQGTQRLRKF